MRRVLTCAAGSYLFLALVTKVAESMGATRCGCSQECWCKRPGLSTFRWVAPVGHR